MLYTKPHAMFPPPFNVVCFHKWSKRPDVRAIRVVSINLSGCRLVGIRGRKSSRMWYMGMERRLNGEA